MFTVLIMYMLFASTFTLGRVVLEYVNPVFFIAIRMLIAGMMLLGYVYFLKPMQWKYDKRHVYIYIQLIFFHIFCAYNLEFWALQYVTGAKTCLLYNLSPFITALFAYHHFSEKLNVGKWLGLGIGFLGFLPILLSSAPSENQVGTIFSLSLPELALIGSVISSAYGWMVMKRLLHAHYSPVMANGIGMIGGGVLSLISSFFIEGGPHLKEPLVPGSMVKLMTPFLGFKVSSIVFFVVTALLLILIANIIGYNLYGFLLKRYSATFLAFAGFMTPLFAALYDWLFLGDVVSWPFFASLCITFIGLYLYYRQELRNPVMLRDE